MSAEKILKPKTMRRGILALLLVAPLVYMFGSLFFALNGAHEGSPFAEPVYVDQWIEVDTYINDGSNYKFVVNNDNIKSALQYDSGDSFNYRFQGTYTLNDYPRAQYGGQNQYSMLIQHYSDETYYRIYTYGSTPSGMVPLPTPIFSGSGGFSLALPWVFTDLSNVFISSFIEYFGSYGQLYKSQLVPSSTYVDNPASFSDYVFGQFFAKDNWLAKLGETTLNGENIYGFHALSDLLKYMDENAFHIGETDWGKLIYGYATYAVNVLILYELIAIGIYVLMIPLKVTDWFGNKGGFDL